MRIAFISPHLDSFDPAQFTTRVNCEWTAEWLERGGSQCRDETLGVGLETATPSTVLDVVADANRLGLGQLAVERGRDRSAHAFALSKVSAHHQVADAGGSQGSHVSV